MIGKIGGLASLRDWFKNINKELKPDVKKRFSVIKMD